MFNKNDWLQWAKQNQENNPTGKDFRSTYWNADSSVESEKKSGTLSDSINQVMRTKVQDLNEKNKNTPPSRGAGTSGVLPGFEKEVEDENKSASDMKPNFGGSKSPGGHSDSELERKNKQLKIINNQGAKVADTAAKVAKTSDAVDAVASDVAAAKKESPFAGGTIWRGIRGGAEFEIGGRALNKAKLLFSKKARKQAAAEDESGPGVNRGMIAGQNESAGSVVGKVLKSPKAKELASNAASIVLYNVGTNVANRAMAGKPKEQGGVVQQEPQRAEKDRVNEGVNLVLQGAHRALAALVKSPTVRYTVADMVSQKIHNRKQPERTGVNMQGVAEESEEISEIAVSTVLGIASGLASVIPAAVSMFRGSGTSEPASSPAPEQPKKPKKNRVNTHNLQRMRASKLK